MQRLKTTFGLRSRLMIMVFLAVVPAFLLIVYSGWQQLNFAREQVRERTLNHVRNVAGLIEHLLEGARELFVALPETVGRRTGRPGAPAYSPELKRIDDRLPQFRTIGILDRRGNLLASGSRYRKPVSFADRPWFREVLTTKRLTVGEYRIEPNTGKELLVLAYPQLNAKREVTRVFFLGLDLEWLAKQLRAFSIPAGSSLLIVDKEGSVVSRVPEEATPAGERLSKSEILRIIRSREQGTSRLTGLDGITRIYSFTPVAGTNEAILAAVGIPEREAYAEVKNIVLLNLLLLLGSTVLVSAIAWYAGGYLVTRRLEAVTNATARMAERGLAARVYLGGSDEIAHLGASFNAMAESLELQTRRRERAEAEQQRLIAELQRSNRELEQFAYAASHDLQEPLRMVNSYMALLRKKYEGQLDEKADRYIHYAVDGAGRMQKLIEGLLAYSRVARRGAEFKQVDVNKVFAEAVSNLAVSIRESGAEIGKGDLPTVSGDETQLVQLFQNLIGNAVKYRKPDVVPRITVGAMREGEEYVFSVRDNGIGIGPEYYEKIFQIFQRLHSRDEYSGTGIGLSLCKRIVERHNGRIWVESEPGRGSTFFFTLPA